MSGVTTIRTRMSPWTSIVKSSSSDLIPTGSLAMKVEYTGLNEKDGQLFRVRRSHPISPICVESDPRLGILYQVTEAAVKSCTEVIKTFPVAAGHLTTESPGKWPRIRCVISSQDKNCPSERECIRVYSWYIPYLRGLYYSLDKYHSYAAAKLAIPLLLNQINNLEEPQLAETRFAGLVGDPGLVRVLVETAGSVTEETLQRFLESTFRKGDGENSGSGS
jgi:hypothetical protein